MANKPQPYAGPRGAYMVYPLRIKPPSSGGRRGRQIGESPASRRRFLRWLATASHIWDWPAASYTITQPGNVPLQVFHAFAKRWVETLPGRAIIWRLELQKRGAWHVHGLLWDHNPQHFIQRWTRLTKASPQAQSIGECTGRWAAYLADMAKRSQAWTHPGRWWGIRGRKYLTRVAHPCDYERVNNWLQRRIRRPWKGGVVFGTFLDDYERGMPA